MDKQTKYMALFVLCCVVLGGLIVLLYRQEKAMFDRYEKEGCAAFVDDYNKYVRQYNEFKKNVTVNWSAIGTPPNITVTGP